MQKRTLWISGLALACGAVAVVAAFATVPPNLGKAIDEQRRLVSERPRDAAVFNDLGNLLVLAGRPAEAEEAYRKAVELAPDRVSSLFNLALLEQQRGAAREAYRLYRRVLEAQPQHAWAWYQVGALHERWKQDDRAVAAYAAALRIDPQLAFPEVNPQVVENRLLTQAMLRAYQQSETAPQAPAMYEEPGRIIGLLVAKPQDTVGGAPAEEPAKPAEDSAKPGDATRPVPGASSSSTVLRSGDLDARSTGQAGSMQGRSPGSRPSSSPSPRGVRTWERPEPATIEDPAGYGYEDPSEEPGAVLTQPPGGTYYRPGISSTGRLDLRVVPDRAREGRG